MSTQPCIPSRSLNRVPASAGVRAGMSPLPGGRLHCVIPYGIRVPVAVWQLCELLYTCYLLTYYMRRSGVHPSVCLSRRSTAAAVCGRFAAERPAGAPNRLSIDIWCGRQRPAAHAVRVMLRAEKRGSKQTCFVCFVC